MFEVNFSLYNQATGAKISIYFLIQAKDTFEADRIATMKLFKEVSNITDLVLTYKNVKQSEK